MTARVRSPPHPPRPAFFAAICAHAHPRSRRFAGKLRAVEVTGPDGAYVQGAPREYDNQYGDDNDGY